MSRPPTPDSIKIFPFPPLSRQYFGAVRWKRKKGGRKGKKRKEKERVRNKDTAARI